MTGWAGEGKPYKVEADLVCPDCGSKMVLRHTRFGPGWLCRRYGEGCRGAHGAHPDGTPLGTPCRAELRKLRMDAHKSFDALWKGKMKRARGRAYVWLEQALKLGKGQAHVGLFGEDECKKLLEAVGGIPEKDREWIANGDKDNKEK